MIESLISLRSLSGDELFEPEWLLLDPHAAGNTFGSSKSTLRLVAPQQPELRGTELSETINRVYFVIDRAQAVRTR